MTDTIDDLQRNMDAASNALDFEEARRIRDRINLMRDGANAAKVVKADTSGLVRQQPGAMGLGTSRQRPVPPPGWKPPPKRRSHDVWSEAKVRIDVASATVLSLLADREPEATICPSEVARKIAANVPAGEVVDWRNAMPIVHAAVDQLVEHDKVELSWKGKALLARSGPYRIGRANGHLRDRRE